MIHAMNKIYNAQQTTKNIHHTTYSILPVDHNKRSDHWNRIENTWYGGFDLDHTLTKYMMMIARVLAKL